jgi:phosphatidylserine/phosphatidylglycerophosphate/cardiolipin synthase-like enzyme
MAGAVDKLCKRSSKLFFPYIKDRMKTKLPISAEFTVIVMGHDLTRSYLHRFNIIPNSTYPCRLQEQIINHIILTAHNYNMREGSYEMP